jgi:F-type H+-transporting ATPase subunit epsilon
MKLDVVIVSAEKMLFTGEAAMVVATAEYGEVGILPGHTPMLAHLKPGQVRVIFDLNQGESAGEEVFYVSSGTLEVQPNCVTVLADTAERAKDLDEAAAQAAIRDAQQFLAEQHSEFDYAKARSELVHAAAQLAAIAKLRDRSKH